MTKYPDIEVPFGDGNVDSLMSRIVRALRLHDVARSEIKEFTTACNEAEDFYGVMSVCANWVTIPDYKEFE